MRRQLARTRVFATLLLVIAVVAAARCGSNDNGTLAVPSRLNHIRVLGDVRDTRGIAVPQAAVTIRVGDSGAPGPCAPTSADSVVTDANGSFSKVIVSGPINFTACILVDVQPPATIGLQARTVAAPSVQFRSTDFPPPESRVQIVLDDA